MFNKNEYFMSIALTEAKKGLGFTSPNPMVGAVIVKNGKILSTGYHRKLGEDHAEVDAIKKVATDKLKGSTLFVTLEPCNHFGRTPPCTQAIIKSGIRKVVIAAVDKDTRVSGTGIKYLINNGVEVITGVLEKSAIELNSIFYHYKTYNKPYIIMKAALTLDGKIASSLNNSKWISNDLSREHSHRLRLSVSSISVGHNTVIQDNPRLNCRIPGFEDKPIKKIIFTDKKIEFFKGYSLFDTNGEVFVLQTDLLKNRSVFYQWCIENEIDSILVEGGGGLYTAFLQSGLIDRIFLFYKPGFMGNDGISVIRGVGNTEVSQIDEFKTGEIKLFDNNIMVELYKGDKLCLPAL